MSDRGSFLTEFMYCPKCTHAVGKALNLGYVNGARVTPHRLGVNPDCAAYAGRVSSSYINGEVDEVRGVFDRFLPDGPCHKVRVVVLTDGGMTKSFVLGGDTTAQD